MNVLPFLETLVKRAALDYREGRLDLDGVEGRMRRLFAAKRKARGIERFKSHVRWRAVAAVEALERTRRAVAAGGVLVAIDVGFRDPAPADELGVTVWRDGVFETVNYVADDRSPFRSLSPCLYGPTEVVSREELLALAADAFAIGDVVAFHDQHCDVEKLALTPDDRIADTMRIGGFWFGRRPSLEDLCLRYGIPTEHAHNSGNDSRRTLEALLKLAGDEFPRLPMRVLPVSGRGSPTE